MTKADSDRVDYSETLNDWKGEPLVVVFLIALEQPIMLSEGATTYIPRRHEEVPWVEFTNGRNFVAIRIWRRTVERLFDYKYISPAFQLARELIDGEPSGEPAEPFGSVPWPSSTYMGSIAEVATPLLPTADSNTQHAISDAFDRCIEELQGFSLAYQSVTNDRRFRAVTRQTCPIILPFCFQRKDDATYFGLGSMTIHEGHSMPFEPEELTPEQQREFEVVWQRRRLDDPFASYIDWSRSARRSLDIDGNYAQSVVATYTSIEMLLNNVLLMCAWEGLNRRDTVRSWFDESAGFLARTRKYLGPLVGGDWTDQNPKSITNTIKYISNIRNVVVHQGRIPNESAARYALAMKDNLEELVKDRLAAKRLYYPRTCLLLLGTPGLERRELWNGKIRRWSDTYADEEPPYTLWFRDWLDWTEADQRCPVPPTRLKDRPGFS